MAGVGKPTRRVRRTASHRARRGDVRARRAGVVRRARAAARKPRRRARARVLLASVCARAPGRETRRRASRLPPAPAAWRRPRDGCVLVLRRGVGAVRRPRAQTHASNASREGGVLVVGDSIARHVYASVLRLAARDADAHALSSQEKHRDWGTRSATAASRRSAGRPSRATSRRRWAASSTRTRGTRRERGRL